jgi:hypothetical protein
VDNQATNTAKARYSQLETLRSPYLERARDCAKLTIPSLIPDEGDQSAAKLTTPYQSIGARGVNNLAAKLLLVLLPPNAPFFRLRINPMEVQKLLEGGGDDQLKSKIEESLSEVEQMVMSEVETTAMRVSVFESLKHLIVGGNVLLHLPPEGGMKVFHLSRYVVNRDPMGNPLEIVTKESVSPEVLPEEVRDKVQNSPDYRDQKTVDLYTHIKRVKNKYEVYQEAAEMRIPDSDGEYPIEKSPWLALRFTKIDGEDYGRGYVEEYQGDLNALEVLSQAIQEGSTLASTVIFGLRPGATTRKQDLEEATNGAFVDGDLEKDLTRLQLDKYADFRVAQTEKEQIKADLAMAFLLHTAIQRDAERVTAEEVRYMAQELETALGGVYSILSQEFQLPLVNRLMSVMSKAKKLPDLPKGIVKPSIVTGLDALGRGHDLTKLDVFLGGAIQTFGPEMVSQYVNLGDYFRRRAAAAGLDKTGLIKTDEEIAQATQQAQMQGMLDKLGPNAVNQIGGMMQQQMAAATQPPQEGPQQ